MSVFSKAGSGFAILAASALVLSGCAAAEEAAPESSDDGTAASEALALKIGTALPVTGSLAFLGPPEEAGVALAAADINAADAGISIEVVYGDSGDLDNKAYETEIPRLLNEGVAAIVGAASSSVSLSFIDQVTKQAFCRFLLRTPRPHSLTTTTMDCTSVPLPQTSCRVRHWVSFSPLTVTRLLHS